MSWQRITQNLYEPVPIAPLVFFRIAFGVIMFIEMMRFFSKGWIERYYIQPEFFFTYDFFHWISPWENEGMFIHFIALSGLAIFIAFGFLYRVSMVMFFLGFTYIFLLDKTNYLNHFYFISLLSFIMIWLPANRCFSIDAWFKPSLKTSWQPAWSLWWLRMQIGIVYFFGGIAKLNSDWLQGEPMRMWLSWRDDFPIIGSFFQDEWMVYLMSYSGLLLDLFIVPALLWKKSRNIAFILILAFHLLNSQLFGIGIFPWFMIAATLIFFPPEIFQLKKFSDSYQAQIFKRSNIITYGLTIYLIIQVLLPFRHWLYPGDVNWTEEGHRFAWHMKLRNKSSSIQFIVDKSGETIEVPMEKYLTRRQRNKIEDKPDMIWQFAQYLDQIYNEGTKDQVKVYVNTECSLNGRKSQTLIDPSVDLSEVEWSPIFRSPWILPLKIPLTERRE